jgi:hypothetical protein
MVTGLFSPIQIDQPYQFCKRVIPHLSQLIKSAGAGPVWTIVRSVDERKFATEGTRSLDSIAGLCRASPVHQHDAITETDIFDTL